MRVTIPRKRHALLQSWAVLPESTRTVLRMHIETLASAIREGYWDAQRQIAVEDLAAQSGKHRAAVSDVGAE